MTDVAAVELLLHGCRMALGGAIAAHADGQEKPEHVFTGIAVGYAGAVEALTRRAMPSVLEEAARRVAPEFRISAEAIAEWLNLRSIPSPAHTFPAPPGDGP